MDERQGKTEKVLFFKTARCQQAKISATVFESGAERKCWRKHAAVVAKFYIVQIVHYFYLIKFNYIYLI